jgi:peptide-methionine (S)-S-oxide reductase
MLFRRATQMPAAEDAPPGRPNPVDPGAFHFVNGRPLRGPWPENMEQAIFALGCFWGAEEIYWQLPGVYVTAAGYAGGLTPNPTYEEVCGGTTGHAEAVLVVFDPDVVAYEDLLRVFWQSHDPTQGMRQGNDVGTQYRSAIFATTPSQRSAAELSLGTYEQALSAAGLDAVTTEIAEAPGPDFFNYAEEHHQQYLAKNPHGYRCHSATGVPFPE